MTARLSLTSGGRCTQRRERGRGRTTQRGGDGYEDYANAFNAPQIEIERYIMHPK